VFSYLATIENHLGCRLSPHTNASNLRRYHPLHHSIYSHTLPMVMKCSPFQYATIQAHLEAGTPAKEIGTLVSPPVGYTTVLKVRKNLKVWGSSTSPSLMVMGRPKKITHQIGVELREYLRSYTTKSLPRRNHILHLRSVRRPFK
jgi:hypothetical protein